MDAVAGVLGVGQGHAGHAVVAVAQYLDPKAVVFLKKKSSKLSNVWVFLMD